MGAKESSVSSDRHQAALRALRSALELEQEAKCRHAEAQKVAAAAREAEWEVWKVVQARSKAVEELRGQVRRAGAEGFPERHVVRGGAW